MKKPEILSPGGSIDSIHAAINAGCDAVYVSGKKYGARAFADNPDDMALVSVIDDVHFYNKKIYITVNTVFTQNDFKDFYRYMKLIYEAGADAVIVQDLGVMSFIHNEFPDLPIHASTQMNIMQAKGANLLKPYGVTRVVPARELSFTELRQMREHTDMEIEIFVQGALCFSCSGQCLMSSLIGGRSGNKGACAQPCRKMYRMESGKSAYYLSLKDLCTLNHIPELINLSVDSFKIEGRMKKPEYVALTTHLYRKYVDMYYELGDSGYKKKIAESDELNRDIEMLKDIYNRGGFTCGYLTGEAKRENMLSSDRPNHLGLKVGKVARNMPERGKAELTFSARCYPQDILEIRDKNCNVLHEHTVKEHLAEGSSLIINTGYNRKKIKNNCDVIRVRNEYLIKKLLDKYKTTLPLCGISGEFYAKEGHNAVLSVWLTKDYHKQIVVYGDIISKALNRPTVVDDIYNKVKVSADTLFVWDELKADIDSNIFIPAGMLKSMRRDALCKLYSYITKPYHRTLPEESEKMTHTPVKDVQDNKKTVIAEVRTKEQYYAVNESGLTDEIYIHIEDMQFDDVRSLISLAKKPVYLVMPRIFRTDGERYLKNNYDIGILSEYGCFKGFVVCTLSELAFLYQYKREFNFDIRSADNLYVRNSYAKNALLSLGVSMCASSVEMTEAEIVNMEFDADTAIYKRASAMITVIKYDDTKKLYDSYGNAYYVIWHKYYGYTEIMHYDTNDLIETKMPENVHTLRAAFSFENKSEVLKVLERIKNRLL